MRFRATAELTPEAVAAITEQVRIRVVRWFARSGLCEADYARQMLTWGNSGFSLDAADVWARRIAPAWSGGCGRVFDYYMSGL